MSGNHVGACCVAALCALALPAQIELVSPASNDCLVGRFKTEDRIPRLVRMTGARNCRDIG